MKNILFVCVENSCRSQMAEAWGRMHGDGQLHVYSSGSLPSGAVNPKAIESMSRCGYDMSRHFSKSLLDIPDIEYDLVVTMGCGDSCATVRSRNSEDWPIPDPKHMAPAQFDEVRDEIGRRVKRLISDYAGCAGTEVDPGMRE